MMTVWIVFLGLFLAFVLILSLSLCAIAGRCDDEDERRGVRRS